MLCVAQLCWWCFSTFVRCVFSQFRNRFKIDFSKKKQKYKYNACLRLKSYVSTVPARCYPNKSQIYCDSIVYTDEFMAHRRMANVVLPVHVCASYARARVCEMRIHNNVQCVMIQCICSAICALPMNIRIPRRLGIHFMLWLMMRCKRKWQPIIFAQRRISITIGEQSR